MSIKKHRRVQSASSNQLQESAELSVDTENRSTSSKNQAKQSVGAKPAENEPRSTDHDEEPFEAPLVWTNIILFVLLHSALPVGVYMIYTRRPWLTLLWSLFGVYISVLGVTAGTHRLWSHRSYKARWPLQVLLMLLQTMAGQNSIYTWSRDHRVHHKFTETNADPHNILRGFFFAHMGWLCCQKHPDVKTRGALVDMYDLEANPVVMFQHRHFWWLAIVFTMLVPTLIPMVVWNETFWVSFVIGFMWRYIVSLHGTWLVNSAAHYHGDRPYDERVEARESPVVIWTGVGEGFHNYHHTFPTDYSTSEYGAYFNLTTAFIDLCSKLGLAYDLHRPSAKTIETRRLRTGDQREIMRQAALVVAGTEQVNQEVDEERREGEEDGIELVSKRIDSCVARNANGGQRASVTFADRTTMKFSL